MTANIATLKNNLSRFLKSVQAGEEVIVLDRDRPVARLVPFRNEAGTPRKVRGTAAQDAARLDAMVQRGAVTHRGDSAATASWAKTHTPAKAPKGTPVLSELFLQMRDEEPW